MSEEQFKPYLYAFMRTDIPQMNPGKGMAQAMHLANEADIVCRNSVYKDIYEKWKLESAQGTFGTTIILEASEEQWETLRDDLYDLDPKICEGFVLDDTYPMTNAYGDFFTRPETTCWFVFAHNQKIKDAIRESGLQLHR